MEGGGRVCRFAGELREGGLRACRDLGTLLSVSTLR